MKHIEKFLAGLAFAGSKCARCQRRLLFFAGALSLLALPARAETAECWIVCSARTGDMAFGATVGGAMKLDGALVRRTAHRVVRVDPATGRRAVVRTFTGGTFTTRMTWAQFVATERKR